MKFYELQIGHKFTFDGKIWGKEFIVIAKDITSITIEQLGTGETTTVHSKRKKYTYEVSLMDNKEPLYFDEIETELLTKILQEAYWISAEKGEPETNRTAINALYKKIKG
ncbi:hypothetical protein [Sphingobacterium sp.]|uniref:hypothetical protein n=1 Tax=Sphingobacterium sp. TaxID=341027 RepID=UPI002FDAC619